MAPPVTPPKAAAGDRRHGPNGVACASKRIPNAWFLVAACVTLHSREPSIVCATPVPSNATGRDSIRLASQQATTAKLQAALAKSQAAEAYYKAAVVAQIDQVKASQGLTPASRERVHQDLLHSATTPGLTLARTLAPGAARFANLTRYILVSYRRSGSTALCSMLNSHPNIIDKGEFVGQSITNYII